MLEFLNNIDYFSLIPATFATLLSLYNWFMMNKPANIKPLELISYGIISSEFHEGRQLCLPLIFHNDGANKGLITRVKVGFKDHAGSTPRYLEVLGRIKMQEVDVNTLYQFDWDSFEQDGYRMQLPTYPIVVEAFSSQDAIFIAQTGDQDIPVGKEVEAFIEVTYDNGKQNTVSFPFMLSEENAAIDNQLTWLEPVEL